MKGAAVPTIHLRVLGPVEVQVDDEVVDLGGPRQRALLALLVLKRGQPVSASYIAEALWDDPGVGAEETVQVYVSRLRKALGPARGLVESAPGGYRLSLRLFTLDSDAFDRLVGEGRALLAGGDAASAASARALLLEADALWRGEPYADLDRDDALPGERHRLEEVRRGARIESARADLVTGDPSAALVGARELLTRAPLDEAAWALSMQALYAMGRQADALAAYHEVRARLDEELGVEPGPILEDAQRAILAQDLTLAAGSTEASDSRVLNLATVAPVPAAISRLIGRDGDLARLEREIAGHRLVTITGPGGVGKTRLALEIVQGRAGSYPDGAGFIDLSSVRDAALVPNAIRDALQVSGPPDQEADTAVIEALRPAIALLALDNLEQVLAAADFVERLTQAAPNLHLLVTSRSPLGIRGEREVAIAPLPLPQPGDLEPELIARNDAVALFIDVIQRHGGPSVDDESLRIAAEICNRVDGLPLALELVAAHARTMSLRSLLERLRGALDIAARDRGLPPRQRTLRAAIRWSVDILSPGASDLLSRCSVFVGGFTRAAAGAVADDGVDVESALDELVRHSLITFDATADRFHMLETIRDFAYDELDAGGAAEETHHRQAAWLAGTLQEVEDAWSRAKDRVAILDRADAERGNVRVALVWASDSGNNELALRLAAAKNFWAVRGGVLEGLRWLSDLVARDADVTPRTLALGQSALAGLALNVGNLELARAQFEAAKPMWEALGERRRVAVMLNNLGIVAERLDQLDLARERTEEALAIMRELEDQAGIAAAVGNLGVLADRLGDVTAAVAYNGESLAIARELDDPLTMSIAATNLGGAALKDGDVSRAQELFVEALQLSQRMNDVEGVIICCEMLSQIALEEGDAETTAMILGGTARLRRESGFAAAPAQERDLLEVEARARAKLGDPVFEELRSRGSGIQATSLVQLAASGEVETPAAGARD